MDNQLLKNIALQLKNKSSAKDLDESDIKGNPAVYALLSKLNSSRQEESFKNNGDLSNTTPDLDYMLGISSEKAQEIDDNETIMQLLPDMERAAQILCSYILSPKYLMKPELQFRPPKNLFPQNTITIITDEIKKYFKKHHDIEGKLYKILYDILFLKGAHITAVIPEAALDEIINSDLVEQSKESYSIRLSQESLSHVEQLLLNSNRPSRGFLGQPNYQENHPKQFTRKPMVSHESVEVHFGNTDDGFEPRVSKSTEHYNTSIRVPENIEFELPKEYAKTHKDAADKTIEISEEGVWNIKFDSAKLDTLVEVSDDLSILRQSFIRKEMLSQESARAAGIPTGFKPTSLERETFSDRNIIDKIFRKIDDINSYNTDVLELKKLKNDNQTARENLDEPIFINYPVEAVIPIFKPGAPSEHVGYLALHDEEGNPLSKAKPVNYYRELANGYNSRMTVNTMASSLIQQGKTMFEGFSNKLDEARQLEMLSRIHSNAIIKDILDRLKNGLYGKNLDVGDSAEVSRIMFYRALRGQRTRVLFVPKEVMSYMAFDYDNRGFGISLLDNMKVLISLRIQFMLAQLRAGIMNSIPETLVTLRIDEKDPDPRKTIQIANVMALQSRSNSGLIIGASNVQTIEDRVNQSNIRMAIESDNPKIPQIGHDVTKTTADIPTPDNEVAEGIKRDTIMGTGLTPDMVDNSLSTEFAANVLQGNFITSLIAFQKQDRFNPLLTDFVRKTISVSPYLHKRLREIIRDNLEEIIENIKEASGDKTLSVKGLATSAIEVLIDGIIDKFISAFEVNLPAPPNDNHESKAEQLQQYEERVDKAIEFVISQDVIPESLVSEDGESMVEQYAKIVKGDLLRDWMLENNYMPEIMNYITVSDDGVQTYEKNKAIRDLTIKTVKAMTEFFKEGKNIADSTSAVLKANDMVIEDDYSSSSSSDSDSDSSGDDMEDPFGDMGDMGDEDPFSDDTSEESNQEGNQEGDANMSGNEAQDGPAD
nr:MAG TPA: capsid assembly protein [Caudoviricetes sp.]